eukprot:SAG31_NODE_4979_length_2823_cov_1.415198_1_plen_803_part_01
MRAASLPARGDYRSLMADRSLSSVLALSAALSVTQLPRCAGSGAAAATCESLVDCNFAGDCVRSRCVCDPIWTGPACMSLNLGPIPASTTAPGFSRGIYPAGALEGQQSTWTWGAAGVQDEKGLYHWFVTQWKNHCPMTYPSFLTETHIVHVTSERPEGPYTEQEEVVPSAAGNPVYSGQAKDGTHLLYFTNYRYTGAVRNCSNTSAAARPGAGSLTAPASAPLPPGCKACGIHLAKSKSLSAGRWTIEYDVAHGAARHWDNCSLTNPGPTLLPNGTVVMLFKLCRYPPNCPRGNDIFGVLTSQGDDYEKITVRPRQTPIINVSRSSYAASVEDPSNGWTDHRGTLHSIAHNGALGLHMASTNGGASWWWPTESDGTTLLARAYNATLSWDDGKAVVMAQREEPKVLLGSDGQPTHLINVCTKPSISHSFVCIQPILRRPPLQTGSLEVQTNATSKFMRGSSATFDSMPAKRLGRALAAKLDGSAPTRRRSLSTLTYTPEAGTLHAADFEDWVRRAAATGATRLILASGKYQVPYVPRSATCIHTGGCPHLNLTANLRDLEIDMSEVELRPQAYNRTAVLIAGWRNVTIRGLDVVYTDDAFSTNQANVIGTGQGYVDVVIPDGYPTRDWATGKPTPCSVFTSKGDFKKGGPPLLSWSGSTPIASNTSSRMYRLHSGNSRHVLAGEKLGCRQIWNNKLTQTSSGTFVIVGCQDSQFIDITIRGSVAYTFYHVGSGDPRDGGNVFTRVSIRRPPAPHKSSEQPLLATNADAFQVWGVPRGPILDSCYFERMHDDGVTIHGAYSLI